MSQVRKIFKNMSWLLISQIIASICGFIWTIIIARYLGVNEYGVLGFAISLTSILAITVDFGISAHIVRDIATNYDHAPKYLGNALPLKSIFACGTLILTLIILILMKSNELTITVTLLFAIEMIFKSFIGVLHASFQAFEEGKYQGISNTLLNLILLLFILISIFTNLGIIGISVSYVISNFIALTYTYFAFTTNIVKPKFELDKKFCKKITIVSLPFAATGLLTSLYYSIDAVMLTNLVGNYPTGIYNATYKLISVLTLFYSTYTAVIFPVMAKFYKSNERMLLISFEKSIKYLMLITIPLAVATMYYSLDITQLIYGPQYNDAASALSILIWTICLTFISGAGNTLLNASHKELSVTKIYFIAALINIILNLFMIPKYSYNGAATTTVISEAAIVILQTYIIFKLGHRPNKKLYVDLIKIVLGSILLGIILQILNINMWIATPIGIIFYFVIIYLFRVFDEDDKYIIKEILGKNYPK